MTTIAIVAVLSLGDGQVLRRFRGKYNDRCLTTPVLYLHTAGALAPSRRQEGAIRRGKRSMRSPALILMRGTSAEIIRRLPESLAFLVPVLRDTTASSEPLAKAALEVTPSELPEVVRFGRQRIAGRTILRCARVFQRNDRVVRERGWAAGWWYVVFLRLTFVDALLSRGATGLLLRPVRSFAPSIPPDSRSLRVCDALLSRVAHHS
jgi:hypothetical protein